jgi:hypothetical protein
MRRRFGKSLGLGLTLLIGGTACRAASITLPGTTDPLSKLDLGTFGAGSTITLDVGGTIRLVPLSPPGGWVTNPDGSLSEPVTLAGYAYANVGSTGYPTAGGGDGTNHFAGGGANYDTAPVPDWGHYGFAGAQTTDTTDPGAIRFGAVVGTFAASPSRQDWFLVGAGTQVTVPSGGAHLYLAVQDGTTANNLGSYGVTYSVVAAPVPLPSSMAGGLVLCITVAGLRAIRGVRLAGATVAGPLPVRQRG